MAFALILLGLFLSAFFSGSETGFYRVTRVRLIMDAKSGRWVAKALLWLTSRPTLVVATVLIGNNIANYLVSLGLVLGSERLLKDWSALQTVLPLLATPVLFVYGELLPKYMYYHVPYQLSKRGAPLLLFCAALFLPISAVVIVLESIWQRISGATSARTRASLERQELQRTMTEGQETGLLKPVQRELGQNLFTFGVKPIRQFAMPLRSLPLVREADSYEEVMKVAQQTRQQFIGILGADGKRLIDCYRLADLALQDQREGEPQLQRVGIGDASANSSTIQVLVQMQSQLCPVTQIVDERGAVLGIVLRDRLISLFLPT